MIVLSEEREEDNMANLIVNQENIDRIEEELDYALGDCYDAPMHIIVKIVLNVLDTAEREKRLNVKERRIACNYITKHYGYSF
mgnify:FL=1